MSELEISKPGIAYWVIGGVALLWNLFGLWAYYSNVTATPETLAALYSQEQTAMILATPKWVTSATALAVTTGVIASMLLLLRNRLAVPFFIVSLACLVIQDVYIFGMSESIEAFGMQPVYIQSVVLVFAVFLAWYARRKRTHGVLT